MTTPLQDELAARLRYSETHNREGVMRKRPIIFSAPMVRAILAGRKTQTRRVVTAHNSSVLCRFEDLDLSRACVDGRASDSWYLKAPKNDGSWQRIHPKVAPAHEWDQEPDAREGYSPPASRLWVRETWWKPPHITPKMLREGADTWLLYVYDADETEAGREQWREWGWRKRPSIHMPRRASRITLEVTRVRVERLQEISGEDAKAEGFDPLYSVVQMPEEYKKPTHESYRAGFVYAWEILNAKCGFSWASSPWVWVIEFRRIEGTA